MEKKSRLLEAAVVALGLLALGLCLKAGIDNVANRNRQVTVRGLSEREVPANVVTWPIQYKELGNDLTDLYQKVNGMNATIKQFLMRGGLTEEEITVNPPSVFDRNSNMWNENKTSYRYEMTSSITVKSGKVDVVRSIVSKKGELINSGIVITSDSNDYGSPRISYDFTGFQDIKLDMTREAIENAQAAAQQFADNSHSRIGGIVTATQGTLSIEDSDVTTPHMKKLRVVTTVTYALK